MSRKFISIIVAASVAVAGMTATQAQADKRTRNVILGAAALAILGAAASDAQRRDDAVTRHDTRHDRIRDHGHDRYRGHDNGRRNDGRADRDRTRGIDHRYPNPHDHHVRPRPLPPRVLMSDLPRRCKVTVENRRGSHKIFEKSCLRRNYRHYDRLPQNCQVQVRAGGQKIRGYSAQCLRQYSQQANWLHRH